MKNVVRVVLLAAALAAGFSFFVARGTVPKPPATARVASPAPAPIEVKIDNFSFGPQSITIPGGTKVTWTNRDDIPHTVVSTEGVFKSRVLDTDESFSFTFDKPGNYPYFCSVHPKMTGTVVVQ